MNIYPWQENIWKQLVSQPGRLPNALLLKGRSGIGKLNFARALSQYLLCEERLPSAPCGKCQGCLWFANDNHPDFRLLEPAAFSEQGHETDVDDKARPAEKKAGNQISVEQIRSLDDFTNLTSHRNGYKIILIHPAEAMNTHAANALLKTLEEPPGNTLFMLISHKPQRLLPTIVSRCRSVAMPVPDRGAALKWLELQKVIEPEIALAQSGYAPLTALEIGNGESQEQRKEFLRQVSVAKLNPLLLAESAQQYPLTDIINWLQKWICDLIYCKFTCNVSYHLDFTEQLQKLSRSADPLGLVRYYQELLAAQRAVQHPLNNQLVLEQLALSYCRWVLNTER
ncbi:MAG TPA: DNA polymerase III subunit delta' [Burkholderiales bacterium]|nr:DNA polymerase III subunit delta' [Burkholderiales bacterium]